MWKNKRQSHTGALSGYLWFRLAGHRSLRSVQVLRLILLLADLRHVGSQDAPRRRANIEHAPGSAVGDSFPHGRTVERRHGVSFGEVEPVQESSHLFGVSTSSFCIYWFEDSEIGEASDRYIIKYPAAAADCPSVCPLRCRRLSPVAHRPLCPPLYAHSCALTTTLISPW